MGQISIEVRGLTIEQLLFFQAVIAPEINALLEQHIDALEELGGLYDREN